MSFVCGKCGVSTQSGVSCKKVVVKTVRIFHPERPRANKAKAFLKNGKKKQVWVPDPGGWGTQIVKEAKLCPPCNLIWEKQQKAAK